MSAAKRGADNAADDYQAMSELTPEEVDEAQNNLLSGRIRSVTDSRPGLLQRYPRLVDRSSRANTVQNARDFVFNDSAMGQGAQQRAVENAAIARSRQIDMQRDPISQFNAKGVGNGQAEDEANQILQEADEGEGGPRFGGATVDRTSSGNVSGRNFRDIRDQAIQAAAAEDAEARAAELEQLNRGDPLYPKPGELMGNSPIDSVDSRLTDLILHGDVGDVVPGTARAPYLRPPAQYALGKVGSDVEHIPDNNVRDFVTSELIDRIANGMSHAGAQLPSSGELQPFLSRWFEMMAQPGSDVRQLLTRLPRRG
jgi:hypothetical protein